MMRTKIIKLSAAILAACFVLAGCASGPNNSSASTADGSGSRVTETTEKGSKTEQTGKDTETGPSEPLELETPAGAVLVGRIRKDENGWYFEPEQPLTVRLTCYSDMTPNYENLTRINMFDDSVDGANKELYRNDIVTITGMLQNYRGDMDSLYLYPCRIEHGKTVKTGYAMPDLDYPSPERPSYDPSLPLPDGMQPTVVNGHYEYNPYILSENTLEGLGNDFAVFYKGFVDAWLAYETSCPCPEKLYAEMFTSVMYYEFPLFTADGEFDLQYGYDEKSQTITWSYKSKTKAEHDKLISDFMADANSFLKNVKASDSEQLRAQAIYHAFSSSVTYDYDIMESRERIEAYYGYTLHRGICVTFANAMSQLFAQVGVKATVVSSDTKSGDGHAWNVVEIDGKNYFCDSTFELSVDSGNSFTYFGMTLKDRLNETSGFIENSMIVGTLYSKPISEVKISEQRLQIK